MNPLINILLLEDSRTDARLIMSCLKTSELRCVVHHCESLADIEKQDDRHIDVALIDLFLPDSQGIDTVRQVLRMHPNLPVVVLSGHADNQIALEALREGAQDYIPKNEVNSSSIGRAVRFAFERHERQVLEKELRQLHMESEAARVVQQTLMPSRLPTIPGFELAARCRTAEAVGGDFFSFVPWPDNRLGIVVGDVSGHGIAAALLMASTQRVIRTLKDYVPEPFDLLSAANVQICEDTDFERFVELFLAVLDIETGRAVYVGAGHGAVLVKNNGDVVNLPGTALPAGMTLDLSMDPEGSFQMEPGDLLAVYTDGLYESRRDDNVVLGQKAIISLLQKQRRADLQELIDQLITVSCGYCAPDEPADDITVALIRCNA